MIIASQTSVPCSSGAFYTFCRSTQPWEQSLSLVHSPSTSISTSLSLSLSILLSLPLSLSDSLSLYHSLAPAFVPRFFVVHAQSAEYKDGQTMTIVRSSFNCFKTIILLSLGLPPLSPQMAHIVNCDYDRCLPAVQSSYNCTPTLFNGHGKEKKTLHPDPAA